MQFAHGEKLQRFFDLLLIELFFSHCQVCETKLNGPLPVCTQCLTFPHIQIGEEVEFSDLSSLHSSFVLDTSAAALVERVKFNGDRVLLDRIIRELVNRISWNEVWQGSTLIPVPLSSNRLFERGFNQSEIIARHLAAKFSLPILLGGLKKTKQVAPQSTLKKDDRKRNVKGVFAWNGELSVPQKVLLIDDIFTTGSTLDACAEVLKKEKVQAVHAWTLFRTPKKGSYLLK